MHIRVEATQLEALQAKLQAMKKRSSDFSYVFEQVGRRIQQKTVNRILEGGIPRWSPTQYPSDLHPPLQRTLRLLTSLESTSALEYGPDYVTYSTDVPYAVFQNYGTRYGIRSTNKKFRKLGSKGLSSGSGQGEGTPARRFMYLEPNDYDFFKKVMLAYIVSGDTGSFGDVTS